MRTINFQDEVFMKDLKGLLHYINVVNNDAVINQIQNDLMLTAFSELIGSEWFISIDRGRRIELFDQFYTLIHILEELASFFTTDES